jgi:hypothetical protein
VSKAFAVPESRPFFGFHLQPLATTELDADNPAETAAATPDEFVKRLESL